MAARIAVRRATPLHAPRRCHLLLFPLPPSPRYSSDFSHLREKMKSRLLPYATDYITPTQTRSLRLTLADFMPSSNRISADQPRESVRDTFLNPTHHLVYFPNVPPSSLLLPDGTDSLHYPGPPFTRRMWAGGNIAFIEDIPVDGRPCHCAESVVDVQAKGKEEEEKIFVRVKRLIFPGKYPRELKGQPNVGPRIVEERSFVFMQDNRQANSPAVSQTSTKSFTPSVQTPDFSYTMVPTRELLFRFSALTMNAHAIHLDRQFCREVEGHRNLLVHGPLTVVLMVEVLRTHIQILADAGCFTVGGKPARIRNVEYRNLAPLYAEEEMKICVKRREKQSNRRRAATWDVWIEGPDGGYKVRGTVSTLWDNELGEQIRKVMNQPAIPKLEGSPPEESIPAEQIALQNAINEGRETVSDEDNYLKKNVAVQEETEEEAKVEVKEEAEGKDAP